MSDLSAVLPTVGRDSLNHTVSDLIAAGVIATNIYVVLPDNLFVSKFYNLEKLGVQILRSRESGQVAQRSFGFNEAVSNGARLILQIDDDVRVSEAALTNLVDGLRELSRDLSLPVAIAPVLKSETDGKILGYRDGMIKGVFLKSAFQSLLHWAPFGCAKVGKIGFSGRNFGITQECMNKHTDKRYLEVDWLPGGIVLSTYNGLILNDFYPFAGKAYAEDVIHSIERQRHGINMYLDLESEAFTQAVTKSDISLIQFIKVRSYILSLYERPKTVLLLSYLEFFISKLFSR